MVHLAPFAYVVQQHRDHQHLAVDPGPEDVGGQRQFILQFELFDLGEIRDHLDRVLVHRVGMVHVELHHRDNRFEFGDECGQDPQFVHPAQRALGISVLQEKAQENPAGNGIISHLVVYQGQVGRDQPHGVWMDQQSRAQPLFKKTQQVQFVAKKCVGIRNIKPAIDHLVPGFDTAATPENALQERFALQVRGFELGQENPGQVSDCRGAAEVLLHEYLDRATAGAVLVPHAFRNLDLHVERQLLYRPPGHEMQVGSHRPEKVLGFDEEVVLFGPEQSERHQFAGILNAIDILGDPEQGLEVAQTSLSLFDIRFDHVAFAVLDMAGIAFLELGLDEFASCSLENFGFQMLAQILGKRSVSGKKPMFEHRRPDREILGSQANAILDCPARMSNLEPQIPENVEHRLDHALGPGGDLVRGQEQQVDIRSRRHLSAPVTAHRDNRDPFTLCRSRKRVQQFRRHEERRRDQPVGQVGIGTGQFS